MNIAPSGGDCPPTPRRSNWPAAPMGANWFLVTALLIVAAPVGAGESTPVGKLSNAVIRLDKDGARIEVTGLAPQTLAALREAGFNRAQWEKLLTVTVAGHEATTAGPMLGKYAVDGGAIVFTPRFPLRPGLAYLAVFEPAAIPATLFPDAERVEATLELPKPPARPATTVAAVYPSGEALPANLLKFYICFSAPMTRGDSHARVRLVDGDDRDVPDAFLELGDELWDSRGMRLTLLFDPGRVKRGLKPHEDVGAPLVEGRRYALVIDDEWLDAQGRPLAHKFIKTFRVTAPDREQPDPARWRLALPPPGTRQPLSVNFDEPLDHALVEHMLAIRDEAGRNIAGQVAIDGHEMRWQFQPEELWQSGVYKLFIDAATEDRAGNSVGRAFETQGPIDLSANQSVVLHFDIPPP